MTPKIPLEDTRENAIYQNSDFRPGEGILFRPLEARDFEACIAMFSAESPGNQERFNFRRELESVFEYSKFIKPVFIVAEHDGTHNIMGFASYARASFSEHVYGVNHLYVVTRYREMGIGQLLVAEVAKHVLSLHGTMLMASVKRTNLLTKCGFIITDMLTEETYLMKATQATLQAFIK